ncbi:Exosome complex protein, partial [Halocaridina rubra]
MVKIITVITMAMSGDDRNDHTRWNTDKKGIFLVLLLCVVITPVTGVNAPTTTPSVDAQQTHITIETSFSDGENSSLGSGHNVSTAMNGSSLVKDRDCPQGSHKCDNGACVNYTLLCNRQDDCGDYSDEHMCNINECLGIQVCAHRCKDKLIGYECQCNEGFRINPNDSKLCDDINECEDYPCPHFCHNTFGSYKCSCGKDYISELDGHKCRANSTAKPKLIFSNRYYIRQIGIDGNNNTLLVANLTNAVGLDYDYEENCIYWSDVTHLSSSVKKMCNNTQPQ